MPGSAPVRPSYCPRHQLGSSDLVRELKLTICKSLPQIAVRIESQPHPLSPSIHSSLRRHTHSPPHISLARLAPLRPSHLTPGHLHTPPHPSTPPRNAKGRLTSSSHFNQHTIPQSITSVNIHKSTDPQIHKSTPHHTLTSIPFISLTLFTHSPHTLAHLRPPHLPQTNKL